MLNQSLRIPFSIIHFKFSIHQFVEIGVEHSASPARTFDLKSNSFHEAEGWILGVGQCPLREMSPLSESLPTP